MTSQGCYLLQCYRDLFCIKSSDAAVPLFSQRLPKDIWNEALKCLRRSDLDVICLANRRLSNLVIENAKHLPLRDLGTVFLNIGKEKDETRLLVSYRLQDEREMHHINPPGNHRKQWRLFLRRLNNAVVHTLAWDARIIVDRKVLSYWREELELLRHLNCHFVLGLIIPVRIECLGESDFFEAMRKRFVEAPISLNFSLNSAPQPNRPTFPYEGEENFGYFTEDERLSFTLKFLTRVVFSNEHRQPIAKRIILSPIRRRPCTSFDVPWSSFSMRFLDVIIDAFLGLRESTQLPSEIVVHSLAEGKQRKSQSACFSSWKHAEKHPYDVIDGGRAYRFENPNIDYVLRLLFKSGCQCTESSLPPRPEPNARTTSFVVIFPCQHIC